LDTRWMSWLLLVTIMAWLWVTHRLSGQLKQEKPRGQPPLHQEVECERFPDQCPCTTELGKGIA
ncbi:MAG: hypothetical protein ACREP5_03690, partial [Candidatus Binatia bacterium]